MTSCSLFCAIHAQIDMDVKASRIEHIQCVAYRPSRAHESVKLHTGKEKWYVNKESKLGGIPIVADIDSTTRVFKID